jgi:hypothetical protein
MKTIKIFRYLDDFDCFVTGIQPGADPVHAGRACSCSGVMDRRASYGSVGVLCRCDTLDTVASRLRVSQRYTQPSSPRPTHKIPT